MMWRVLVGWSVEDVQYHIVSFLGLKSPEKKLSVCDQYGTPAVNEWSNDTYSFSNIERKYFVDKKNIASLTVSFMQTRCDYQFFFDQSQL